VTPLDEVRRALAGERAWLVGGAVRDRLLGRPTDDLDVAIDGDPARAAKALRQATHGAAFPLSETFGGWRVVGPGHAWHVDLLPLLGGDLATDLAARDFTFNAMAEPLAGGELVDPHGGEADLEARVLRVVGPRALEADPLRTIRAVRLAAELGCTIEPGTMDAVRAYASELARVAPERVFAELKRVVGAQDPVAAVRLMTDAAVTGAVLPELLALRGVDQSVYHHADVFDHTLEVLGAVAALERDPSALDPRVGPALAEPLADELTRWGGLRFGALLHDIAKPATRAERPDGRGVSFLGHDKEGAAMTRAILRRLRASTKLADHVAALAEQHLWLGFLVHEAPLSRRSVYRYLTTTAPRTVDVTVLTVADRFATRGRNAEPATAAHLELARAMLDEAFAYAPGEPLIRGDELARELGVRPGPRLGAVLAALEEEHFAGEITTREEAVERARRLL
jgi:poly(A) polymerase